MESVQFGSLILWLVLLSSALELQISSGAAESSLELTSVLHQQSCTFSEIPQNSCPNVCFDSDQYGQAIATWMCASRLKTCTVTKCGTNGYSCSTKKKTKNTVSVEMMSAGYFDGDTADIIVNGLSIFDSGLLRTDDGPQDGMNIAILSQGTGSFSSFFADESRWRSGIIQSYFHGLPFGTVVLIAFTADESTYVEGYTKFLLESFGSKLSWQFQSSDSFVMIGRIGAPPGYATEKLVRAHGGRAVVNKQILNVRPWKVPKRFIDVQILSSGDGDGEFVGILVNGLSPFHSPKKSFDSDYDVGLNVAVLHPKTGEYVGFRSFEIRWDNGEFQDYIASFQVGYIVIIGVAGRESYMSVRSRMVIESLGSTVVNDLGGYDGFAMIGRIRAKPGSAIEKKYPNLQGPGRLRVRRFRLSSVPERSNSVDIRLHSGAADDTDTAELIVNGKWYLSDDQINIAVIDNSNGAVKTEKSYTPRFEESEILALLKSLKASDTLLVAVTGDSGDSYFTNEVRKAFEAVGSAKVMSLGYRDNWVMVSRIGTTDVTEVLTKRFSGAAELSIYDYKY